MSKKHNKKSKNDKIDLTEISKLIVCALSMGRSKTDLILKLNKLGFTAKRIGILLNTPTKDVTSILIQKRKKAKRNKK